MSIHEALRFLPLLSAVAALLVGALALRRGPHPLVAGSFVAGMWGIAAAEAAAFLASLAPAGERALEWLQVDLGVQCLSTLAWLVFAIVFGAAAPRAALRRWRWWAAAAGALALGFAGLLALGLAGSVAQALDGPETVLVLSLAGRGLFVFLLLGGLAVLMLLEQAFRGSSGLDRWRTKYLVLGVAAALGFQMYASSQALLFPVVRPAPVPARSVAVLAAAVLIGYSLARRGLFGATLFVSRQFVYRSVTVSIVSAYLLAMGAAGEAVRRFGIPLDQSLKAVAVLVAAVALAVALLSARFRRRLQFFIATHFYRHKYDYRRTWMDFTKRLSGAVRVEEILPRIAEMVAETVWVRSVAIYTYDADGRRFDPGVAINVDAPPVPEGAARGLGELLPARQRPVLPDDLPGLPLAAEARGALAGFFARSGLVALVPLVTKEALVGLIGVGPEASGKPFAEEDWQLLATIAGQAAGAIVAARLAERLLATREMEAFHRLSAFVMHDVKNALAMLRPLLDNAREFIGDPAFQQDALSTIESAANRMEGLMRKLSGAPAPGAGPQGPMDLNEVVRAALAACPIGRWPGITVVEDLSPLPPLRGNPAELQNVVNNLLLNAAEALEGRPGAVTIRTAQDGAWATLAVSDTGKGMDEDFRRHCLFRPFRTTKPKGLGIGLFQCKAMVEAHGGQIAAESADGKGTTFTVRLPVRSDVEDEPGPERAALAGSQGRRG
ncbi:MAG TPA: XrtA/PEP-CTERM system histidine kinase PrsK [Candidatus Sulfotelmatobacter sp.]|nr:XrtA/PEP-CTERM system histidine kinase PrsK [Candidatus Sulfotelmatobacter sp.]